MRVSLVVPRYYPYFGGVETHTVALAESLSKLGVHVTLHTLGNANDKYREEELQPNIYKKTYGLNFFNKTEIPPYKKIAKNIVAENPDILHLQMYHQPLSALVQRELKDHPIVVTPHYHGEGKNRFTTLLHKPWGVTLGKSFLENADAIIAVSDSEKEKIIKNFTGLSDKITVIPNGVDTKSKTYLSKINEIPDFLRQEIKPDSFVVTYVGRVEKYKNIDKILEYSQGKNWKIVIVGEGRFLPKLVEINNSLTNKAVILGKLDSDKVEEIFSITDCYVTLSSQEAFGLNVAQLATKGVPVVCSSISAHSYIKSLDPLSNILLADPSEKRDVVAKINKCSQLERKKAMMPSWDEVGRTTKDLYKEVVEKFTKSRGK